LDHLAQEIIDSQWKKTIFCPRLLISKGCGSQALLVVLCIIFIGTYQSWKSSVSKVEAAGRFLPALLLYSHCFALLYVLYLPTCTTYQRLPRWSLDLLHSLLAALCFAALTSARSHFGVLFYQSATSQRSSTLVHLLACLPVRLPHQPHLPYYLPYLPYYLPKPALPALAAFHYSLLSLLLSTTTKLAHSHHPALDKPWN